MKVKLIIFFVILVVLVILRRRCEIIGPALFPNAEEAEVGLRMFEQKMSFELLNGGCFKGAE